VIFLRGVVSEGETILDVLGSHDVLQNPTHCDQGFVLSETH